ncbi:hypothetical protein LTR05_003302 [Lithohypha guttulata]|uniref:Methyltransferase type 11 domain-containing protein n=1 Tax=Lithohypha guttulata TaxID=1690604 RepID=A0AAN7T5F4_9EURO|nr:hypothetical protein LTR05_003302 [Lithohypha guttulata]
MADVPPEQEILTKAKNDASVSGQIKYLSTAEAYDLWSEVYDTDGNFLQALDTIEMKTLLPTAIRLLNADNSSKYPPWKAVDLGCGTGRNTLQLLNTDEIHEIIGLELSPKMMQIAQDACHDNLLSKSRSRRERTTKSDTTIEQKVTFETYDMITSKSAAPAPAKGADLVVSTLVLEHIPTTQIFFETCANMLRPGGVLLCTNMHAQMGKISQAGFVDPKTGDKIRPVSYAHTVEDVVMAAEAAGLELVGGDGEEGVKEVAVDETLAERLGQRGKKWVGVTVWFGGLWKKT